LTQGEIEAILTEGVYTRKTRRIYWAFIVWFYWYSFNGDEERYAYLFQHNLIKMYIGVNKPFTYVIHPAFRSALVAYLLIEYKKTSVRVEDKLLPVVPNFVRYCAP